MPLLANRGKSVSAQGDKEGCAMRQQGEPRDNFKGHLLFKADTHTLASLNYSIEHSAST